MKSRTATPEPVAKIYPPLQIGEANASHLLVHRYTYLNIQYSQLNPTNGNIRTSKT